MKTSAAKELLFLNFDNSMIQVAEFDDRDLFVPTVLFR